MQPRWFPVVWSPIGKFRYLRVVVNSTTMTIEFHPESDGGVTKTLDDTVTINLADYTMA
jgi:hypothetical protein